MDNLCPNPSGSKSNFEAQGNMGSIFDINVGKFESKNTMMGGFINDTPDINCQYQTSSLSTAAGTPSHIDWTKVQKLSIADFEGSIETQILSRSKGTVTTAEFTGRMTIKNLHLVLQLCNNLHRLIFSDIYLVKFQYQLQSCDFHRYPVLKVIRVTELVFRGPTKLTEEELEILNFFNSRIKFTTLNTLRFLQCDGTSKFARTSVLISRRLKAKSSTSTSNHSGNNHLGILDQFISTYAGKLKTLEVTRVQLKFKLNKVVPLLSLSKLCGDLANESFTKILSSQKNLRVLDVFNDQFVPLQIYENVACSILSCQHVLQDIRISNKYIVLEETGVNFSQSFENAIKTGKSNALSFAYRPDTAIDHNLLVYKNCRNLKKLSVDISKVDYPNQNGIHAGEFSHLEGLPLGLESLLLRFDKIETKYLEGMDKIFGAMTKLKQFVFHGSSESLYVLDTAWIETLVRLPLMEIFEFHFCVIDVPAVEILAESITGLLSRLAISQSSCVYCKKKEF